MVKSKEKIEQIDVMIDRMERITAALKEIRDNDACEAEVCRKNGLDYASFRRAVYNIDWEKRDTSSHVPDKIKAKLNEPGICPTKSWAEDLYCIIYGVRPNEPVVPRDVKERLTEIIQELPGIMPSIIFMRYRDGMTLDEVGDVLGKTRERVRQIEVKAIRLMRATNRTAYIFMGGVPLSRVRMEELNEKVENDYYVQKRLKELQRLDHMIEGRKYVLRGTKMSVELEDLHLFDIHFSVRAYNALKRADVRTIGDICAMTFDDLKNIKNMGPKTANEVVEEIGKAGFKLAE